MQLYAQTFWWYYSQCVRFLECPVVNVSGDWSKRRALLVKSSELVGQSVRGLSRSVIMESPIDAALMHLPATLMHL